MKKSITWFYFNMLRWRIFSHILSGRKKIYYKMKYKKIVDVFNRTILESSIKSENLQSMNIIDKNLSLDEKLIAIENFINDQMPVILETQSQLNARLLHIEKSLPVALRRLTREGK